MTTPPSSTASLMHQIEAHCTWYFRHAVQVLTFHHRPSNFWFAIVVPADAALSDSIHISARAARSAHSAAGVLLRDVQDRLGECFSVVDGVVVGVVPAEARCGCVRRAGGYVAGQGGGGVVSSGEAGAAGRSERETVDTADGACSLRVQASVVDVVPVQQETPETTKQQPHLPAAETAPVQNTAARERLPSTTTVEPRDQPAAPEPDDTPISVLQDAALTATQTRELIREEVGRALSAAIRTLPGDSGRVQDIVRYALEAAVASLARSEG